MGLKVQSRTVVLDGAPLVLRADFNAMYTLEQELGQNLFGILQRAEQNTFSTLAQLLYALSATHREDSGQVQTFKEFLKSLPGVQMAEYNRLQEVVYGLVNSIVSPEETASGNVASPAAEPAVEEQTESTGDGSTTLAPSSSDAATVISGG